MNSTHTTHLIPPRRNRRAAAGVVAALALTTAGGLPATADERHRVSSGETVSALAVAYGTTVATIVSANGLDSRATIYVGQTLSIPTSTGTSTKTATTKTSGTHTVAAGDTVWGLARANGTTVAAIIAANALNASATIRIGQVLTIPGASSSSAASASSGGSSSTTTATHKVVAGDTVWDLARKYGTSVARILSANGLSTSGVITIGQRLTIPGASAAGTSAASGSSTSSASSTTTSTTTTTAATASHTVKSGETLSSIAVKYGVTVSSIVSANGIKNPALIRIGQTLTIPGAVSGLVGDTFAGRTYSTEVVSAANRNKATLLAMSVPTKAQIQSMVVSTASSMGVDTALAQAIAYQESGFNMRAVSPANAIGAMQVIPTSGEWASDLVGRDLDLLDAEDNVVAGVAILRQLLRTSSSLETAIAGYYQGAASVRKYGMFADTKRYVASVLALMDRFE
ncbi:LysM peptidoglycan-binding domain-containing protein [Demequina salsinemoris]|uniref:LysM peptidoglycan-binding domain-containing protein n=1 Tax=Demequina salsinemoris TaxID=577470 RepID=UPI000AAA0B91|nr:LysM peptidoglycan-binding domain-containing protein [Demequina salsinemoris]